MADKKIYYSKTGLTGGTATDLDSIDGDSLQEGEIAYPLVSGKRSRYHLDATIGGTTNSPFSFPPATNPGTKRWVLDDPSVDQPTAENDILVGAPSPFGKWVKKTLAEFKAILLPSPGPIGGTTPGTGAFTTLSRSTANTDNQSDSQVASTAFVQSQLASVSNPKAMSQAVNFAAGAIAAMSTPHSAVYSDTTNSGGRSRMVALPSWTPAANQIIYQKLTGGAGVQIEIVATTGVIRLTLNATVYNSAIPGGGAASSLLAGSRHRIAIYWSVGATQTTVTFYLDGVLLSSPAAQNNVDLTNTAVQYLMGTSAATYAGIDSGTEVWKRVPSAAEERLICLEGISEADKWANVPLYLPPEGIQNGRWGGYLGGVYNPNLATFPSTGWSLTRPVSPSLNPGANQTLHQNGVDVLTSEEASAVANTLYLKAGNVGIGTTGPAELLTIGSEGILSTTRQAIRINSGGYAAPGAFNTASNGDKLILHDSTGTGYDARIGIGVQGDMWFKSSESGATTGIFSWYTGETPTERMRLSGTGGLSLGSAYVATDPGAGSMIISGNVGIGTTGPNYKLEIGSDSAGKPGAGGLWTVVSDKQIKMEIELADLARCYEIVRGLPLKRFAWAEGVYSEDQVGDRHSLGWVAQDVQKVFSKSVSSRPFTKNNGEIIKNCLDMNSGQVLAAMYGALQKAIQKIDELETKIAV